ncbi:hypothetical protein [Aureivirga sp. CE67]|uniref:hypothetical protein n=1 Tax=Aureivirga sp. CE67 TaxID=1788983 RepID=UPI0018C9F144|nr:hypothetical protein [Aureivirga sp. CE67]
MKNIIKKYIAHYNSENYNSEILNSYNQYIIKTCNTEDIYPILDLFKKENNHYTAFS